MTTENQAEREKLADAVSEIANMPFDYGEPWLHDAQRETLRAAADALRAARPTGAHRRVAEEIDALCYRAACVGWSPTGVKWVQQHEHIAALLADLPGGLVLTAEDARFIDAVRSSMAARPNDTSDVITELLAIITRATKGTAP